MSLLQAFILGVLQGITEFLPISSSGHLKLGQMVLGFSHLEQFVTFDLICHLGTLFAILAVFNKEIFTLFTNNKKQFALIFIATLPLLPLYFILSKIKAIYGEPQYLGYFFLLSALLLFSGEYFAKPSTSLSSFKKRSLEALFIGLFQAIAILPAVSRSGATIAAARYLGWQREEAAKFSFFLAIPTILGGFVIEGKQILHSSSSLLSPATYLIGFLTSFIVGYFALKGVLHLFKSISLKPFALYCFIIGILATLYTHIT